ncbi:MAG: HDOD domain-containing protein [Gallionella sp.]
MIDNNELSLIDEVFKAIEGGKFDFPVLPDVANRVRDLVNNSEISAREVFAAISGDIAISAHLIKVANSAAYSDKPAVEHVHQAISRLGYMQVHNLVLELTLGKLLHAKNQIINQYLTRNWARSCEVAAVCYVLAKNNRQFNADQAMLAGLLHNIGALPVCLYIEQAGLELDEVALCELVDRLQFRVGALLLRAWNFPDTMVKMIEDRLDGERASYADIVSMADLLVQSSLQTVAWHEVAAVRRLGLDVTFCEGFLQQFAEQLDLARGLLGMETKNSQANQTREVKPVISRSRMKVRVGLLTRLANFLGIR